MTVELGNKKCRNFNTNNVVLFLKKKKKKKPGDIIVLHLCTKYLDE